MLEAAAGGAFHSAFSQSTRLGAILVSVRPVTKPMANGDTTVHSIEETCRRQVESSKDQFSPTRDCPSDRANWLIHIE